MTFYELEKRCKKRKFVKYVVLIFLLLIISGSLYYLFSKKVEALKTKKQINIKQKIKDKNISKSKKVKKEIIILPSIDLNVDKNIDLNKSKIKKNIKKTEKKLKKSIIKTENLPSFQTCISIAKKYFEQKDYENALKWAKYANIQNKKNALSWIITAKILYKMGKKQEAIKLLKIYNSYYNNKEIKKLIKEYDEK